MDLTSITFVSVDGVYQGPGGPQEDTSDGFDRGGWQAQFGDEETGAFIDEIFRRADGFVLGRRTYEIFSSYWPHHNDPNDPVSGGLNALPKYVASSSLKDPEWNNTTVLEGDLVQAMRDLKARPGKELQVWGSGALLHSLLDAGLMDRVHLLVYPIIVGKGKRLFGDDGLDTRLALEESRTTPAGVTIATYRPDGRPEYGTVGE